MKLIITIFALLILSGLVVTQLDTLNLGSGEITAEVESLSSQDYGDQNFKKAFEPIPFEFPKDHGPHNDFRAEWWYYTGNLADA